MFASPCFLSPTNPVIATHAHFLGVVASICVWTAQHLVFVLISFETLARALMLLMFISFTVINLMVRRILIWSLILFVSI